MEIIPLAFDGETHTHTHARPHGRTHAHARTRTHTRARTHCSLTFSLTTSPSPYQLATMRTECSRQRTAPPLGPRRSKPPRPGSATAALNSGLKPRLWYPSSTREKLAADRHQRPDVRWCHQDSVAMDTRLNAGQIKTAALKQKSLEL